MVKQSFTCTGEIYFTMYEKQIIIIYEYLFVSQYLVVITYGQKSDTTEKRER